MELKKIHILIADDHPSFREGLANLLKDEADFEIVATVGDGEEAVESARKLQPDVVILDVSMARLNGIEAARQIRVDCPSAAILMLSAFSYSAFLLGSLRAGAMGYLPKNTALDKLVSAIRMVHGGEVIFNLKTIRQMLSRSSSRGIEELMYSGELHPREVQILKLVAKGASNKQIGAQLGISKRTVQSHLINIYNKLAVNSRTEAVLQAVKDGWLSAEDLLREEDRR